MLCGQLVSLAPTDTGEPVVARRAGNVLWVPKKCRKDKKISSSAPLTLSLLRDTGRL